MRKLVRSEKRTVCESDVNESLRKKKFFHECSQAKFYFHVVICVGIFLLPVTLPPVLFKVDSIECKEY